MMVSRQKTREMFKCALSVTKNIFQNEVFPVSAISVFPVTFPPGILSRPAMKTGCNYPLVMVGLRGGLEAQRLTSAWGAYRLELLAEIGCRSSKARLGLSTAMKVRQSKSC